MNYRSYQEILDFSNWLLERSPLDYNNDLLADRGIGHDWPTLAEFDSNLDEASWIADTILERRETDIQFRDIMILVRSSYDARPIEAELMRRKTPYYFVGGTSLTKLGHVRDVLSLLRIVRNEQDDLAWMRFLKLWSRIGEKTAEKLVNSFYECDGAKPIEILAGNLGASHPAVSAYKQTCSNQSSTKVCISSAVQSLTPILKERYDKWDFRSQDLKLLIKVSERYRTVSNFIDAFTLEPMTGTEIETL